MRVLAIDPGYGRCGVAVLEKTGGKETLLFSDCIETSAGTLFDERLHTVASECERLIEKFKPDSLAMEKLFFEKNRKTAMKVAEVRGALLHCAATARVPTVEYTPMQVKSALGYGKADKKQVARMIHMLIKIEKAIVRDDEYDAIAVGITHLAYTR